MDVKQALENNTWSDENYYLLAEKGSLDVRHPGMRILKKLSLNAKNILDLGCGEGTRLNFLDNNNVRLTGTDVSSTGISIAKKKYPGINFIKADLEEIPLKDNSFDLIYSAYVLEHLSNPEKVISEAARLLSTNGLLVLIAPNYGAPNRSSPCFKGSRLKKFAIGLMDDFKSLIIRKDNLGWQKVDPISTKEEYHLDWDTTIEPYIGSLLAFLRIRGFIVQQFTSCWSQELASAKIHQVIFRYLAKFGLFPFYFWGPHLVVVAKKG